MDYKAWTEKEVGILRKYYNRVSTKHLAKAMGRTKSGVTQAAKRYGIDREPYKHSLDIDPNIIATKVAQRKTVPTIASELGVSRSYIKNRIAKMPQWVRERSYRNGKNASCKAAGKATSEVMRKRREAA
jgi:hypothetical protein